MRDEETGEWIPKREAELLNHYNINLEYQSVNPIETLEDAKASKSAWMLDVGCGDGRAAVWPHKNYLGIDYSITRCRAARKRFKDATFLCASLQESLPKLATNSFDLVYCAETLEHLEDPLATWAQLLRICSGQIVATVPVNNSYKTHLTLFPTLGSLNAYEPTTKKKKRTHYLFTRTKCNRI